MIPHTFQEATMYNESEKWIEAMNPEMDSPIKNNTWTLVSIPKTTKVLDVKWIYKKELNDEYKARLIVRGFQEANNIEDQIDVEAAFLNGKVLSQVYVKQPLGLEDDTDSVCKLNKALYGLKESPCACQNETNIMDCFVNANWAGDIVDRKSTTGFVIRLYGNSIYWKSKKLSIVIKSSTYVEYIALSEQR
ncbi:Copia protein [Anthophora quadrimaculata]